MIRTRFAPSPTGFLHVGGLRTALYNYLFAKQKKGKFILRIEDTDQKRHVENAMENLINTLKKIGLDFDEGPEKKGNLGPYIQSQRIEIYQKHAEKLLESEKAYHCFCTPERLEEMRASQQAQKKAPMYDRKCLNLKPAEIEEKLKAKIPFVIRQKIPQGQNLKFEDIIHGTLRFNTTTIDDQVLVKSDGFPTYHLANVVDDHLMETSHVIRGEEWLPSTPKHILLYEAFGWDIPKFAHLPLLLNKDRSKLSKRQGDIAAEDFLKKGYLKEALINFIALLGWNKGEGSEQEIFSMEELIKEFDLTRVQKSGAVFDTEKLNWINGKYIRKLSVDELTDKIIPYLKVKIDDRKYLEKCIALIQDRLKNLSEAPELLKFFLVDKLEYDKSLFEHEKMQVDLKMASKALENTLPALEKLEDYEDEKKVQEYLIQVIEELDVQTGQVLWPIRVALTGEKFSPGVFEVIRVLGKEKTLQRIKEGIELISR